MQLDSRTRATLALCVLLAGAARGQPASQDPPVERVVLGEQYRTGGFQRFLFGKNHRELWTTPVELPVLDLATVAGGLTPVRKIGHGQTKALALKGGDGNAYTFRSVVKDPIGLLPRELRETLAARFVRDQMSSQHPAGHVVVPPLLEALGILHNTPRLVVLPDHPALGEFRDEFKGVAGDFEEYTGQAGYGGASEIVDGEEMWKRLEASPEVRVDTRAYLAARLVDHLVGDWDRHRDQWRWARLPGRALWQPIPEDRDQAFVKFQGFAIRQVRGGMPFLISFGPEYPSLDGLSFDSWDVDRRLLSDLEREAWSQVAAEVRNKLTDDVLESGVRRLPLAFFDKDGPALLAALKRRRDGIPGHAERFYRYVSRQVDVRGTHQAESARARRFENGDLELSLALKDAPQPYFTRRFRKGETEELRLYLLGGDDDLQTSGPRGGIRLRLVPGDGHDTVDDSASGGTRVADPGGRDRVVAGPGTSWDKGDYVTPPPNPRGAWIPARDWGRYGIFPLVRITGQSDLGLLFDVGLLSTGYGFRQYPYADKQRLRVGYASGRQAFRADYRGVFLRENSKLRLGLDARASGIDLLRFYGFGNETSNLDAEGRRDDEFFEVEQSQFAPSLILPFGARSELRLGLEARYASTDFARDRFIGRARPYGSDGFGQAGVFVALEVDSRDKLGLPSRGVLLTAGASYNPSLWDVESGFGELHGQVETYLGLTTGAAPTLVLRAGGQRVYGTYPFHEAAFLGGGATLRGLRMQRYAGDAALYGSAELRVSLGDVFFLVPAELGLFALCDVGRVYVEGEDSGRWHRGFGGGLYFASPERRSALSVALARSEGRTGFYVRAGIGF